MPKKPPQEEPEEYRGRIDLRIDPEVHARVAAQAKRRGIGVSAYIKQATSLMLERDEAEAAIIHRPKP